MQKANPDVNYTDYDSNGDGYVDGVHVIFAGYDQAQTGVSSDAIWSHKWQIPKIKLDSKWIQVYSCSSELRENIGNTISTIGTACHEFGHVLGAPDFYDLDGVTGGQFAGTGEWDLMAGGSWNGPRGASGNSPAHINPYTKINTFGWATAKAFPSDNSLITLLPANSDSNSFYKVPTSTSGEYFLIENRQRLGFDIALPGHGMIVWHVHSQIESNSRAINTTHPQRLYPVCASAAQNPNSAPGSYGAINSGGCPFPGTSVQRSLTFATTPSLRSWTGISTRKDIQFITEKGNIITFIVNPEISGSPNICGETTYSIVLPEDTPLTWKTSPDIITVSQTNGSITVKRSAYLSHMNPSSSITAEIGSPVNISIKKDVIAWKGGINETTDLMDISSQIDYANPSNSFHTAYLKGDLLYTGSLNHRWSVGGLEMMCDDGTMACFRGDLDNPGAWVSVDFLNPCGVSTQIVHRFNTSRQKSNILKFMLSPNPATTTVTIQLQEPAKENAGDQTFHTEEEYDLSQPGIVEIQLWSATSLLRKFTTDRDTYQFSVADLPRGIYFVRVIRDGKTHTQKLIKN